MVDLELVILGLVGSRDHRNWVRAVRLSIPRTDEERADEKRSVTMAAGLELIEGDSFLRSAS